MIVDRLLTRRGHGVVTAWSRAAVYAVCLCCGRELATGSDVRNARSQKISMSSKHSEASCRTTPCRWALPRPSLRHTCTHVRWSYFRKSSCRAPGSWTWALCALARSAVLLAIQAISGLHHAAEQVQAPERHVLLRDHTARGHAGLRISHGLLRPAGAARWLCGGHRAQRGADRDVQGESAGVHPGAHAGQFCGRGPVWQHSWRCDVALCRATRSRRTLCSRRDTSSP